MAKRRISYKEEKDRLEMLESMTLQVQELFKDMVRTVIEKTWKRN